MTALKDSIESLSLWSEEGCSSLQCRLQGVEMMSFSVGSYIALHSGTWYNWEYIFLECLRGGQSVSLLLTDTLPWEIYTSRRVSLCQSSRLSRLRCCTNMSPALDACLFYIHIHIMYNTPSIGIIHRFSRLVTLMFHKWLIVRLNHKDACILTLT